MKKSNWQCRIAPSLGDGFAGTPNEVWGTVDYKNDTDPTVFFGLYGLPDFYALWRHKGMKAILWAGSDILHFRKGYWLEDSDDDIKFPFQGDKKEDPDVLAQWINKHCENYVENEAEAWQLKDCGIRVDGVVPSFLGDVKDYPIRFKPGNKVYASCSSKNYQIYSWDIIGQIACSLPNIEFHLYGADWPYQPKDNIICHGRVSQAEMNKQIKDMQCGLRLLKHDGFSEITAKSILWGQYPITYLYFPEVAQYTADDCGTPDCLEGLNNLVKLLREIPKKKKPNIKARAYYLRNLNKYPWNSKI